MNTANAANLRAANLRAAAAHAAFCADPTDVALAAYLAAAAERDAAALAVR